MTPAQPFAAAPPPPAEPSRELSAELRAWCATFVRVSYRERLARAGGPECELCGARHSDGELQSSEPKCRRCGAPFFPVDLAEEQAIERDRERWEGERDECAVEVNEQLRGSRY